MRGTREQTMYDELVKGLRETDFSDGCPCEAEPMCASADCIIAQAADAIEKLRGALLLMVLQYCTTDDGLLYHSFMSAGEKAFAVLGLKNGQQAEPLWDRVLIQDPPKEE